jgi:IclR family transcriptional regulator, KDG regulon repressor
MGLPTQTVTAAVRTPVARAAVRTLPLGGSPQLLERTFVVLGLFTPERREWTVTEMGRASGLAIPTVHRIVSALHRNGFLARHEISKRYHLGPAVIRLGRTAAMTVDLRTVSQPVLRRISLRTKETSVLTIVSETGRTGVCLDRFESLEPLRLSVQPGNEIPLHAGASQKILLAHLPVEDTERVLAEPLERLCSATITDADCLRAELGVIRRRGWASSYEETNQGVWGLSVGLIDEYGYSVAAIGVAGPCERRPRALGRWLSVLSDGANDIATELGLRASLTLTAVSDAGTAPCAGPSMPAKPLRSCSDATLIKEKS